MGKINVNIGADIINHGCIERKLDNLFSAIGVEVNRYVRGEIEKVLEIINNNEIIDKNIENRISERIQKLEKEIDDLARNSFKKVIAEAEDKAIKAVCNGINVDRLKIAFREGLNQKVDRDL